MEKRIDKATELSELLGIEGNASASYFGSFDFMLKKEMGFDFQRRSRRPHSRCDKCPTEFCLLPC